MSHEHRAPVSRATAQVRRLAPAWLIRLKPRLAGPLRVAGLLVVVMLTFHLLAWYWHLLLLGTITVAQGVVDLLPRLEAQHNFAVAKVVEREVSRGWRSIRLGTLIMAVALIFWAHARYAVPRDLVLVAGIVLLAGFFATGRAAPRRPGRRFQPLPPMQGCEAGAATATSLAHGAHNADAADVPAWSPISVDGVMMLGLVAWGVALLGHDVFGFQQWELLAAGVGALLLVGAGVRMVTESRDNYARRDAASLRRIRQRFDFTPRGTLDEHLRSSRRTGFVLALAGIGMLVYLAVTLRG